MEIELLIQFQTHLASQLILPEVADAYAPNKSDLVLSLDIQYAENQAFVAGNLHDLENRSQETFVGWTSVEADYAPGFFCFREGPPLFKFIRHLEKYEQVAPNMLILDGHGIAHPRKFGVACWLGLALRLPTLGCAKDTLLPYQGDLGVDRGDSLGIYQKDELLGYAIRTQKNVKPVFGSVGNMLHLELIKEIILKLATAYRVPEPLRKADQAARLASKNQFNSSVFKYLHQIEDCFVPYLPQSV